MKDLKQTARDFTVMETCEFFRVTAPTVYRLMNQGKLESYTLGRCRRITQESIQALRKQRT